MRIYLASSWRNALQPKVLAALRAAGHEVYDFRNPAPGDRGFAWAQIDPDWFGWNRREFAEALQHPIAQRGFEFDMSALRWCDCCVLLQPCGRSAHMEFGWAAGAGKKTVVMLAENQEPELMYLMGYMGARQFACSIDELLETLRCME